MNDNSEQFELNDDGIALLHYSLSMMLYRKLADGLIEGILNDKSSDIDLEAIKRDVENFAKESVGELGDMHGLPHELEANLSWTQLCMIGEFFRTAQNRT